MKQPRRGEIWLSRLNPVRGSEQAGTRPILIIQRNTLNQHSPVTIGLCLTSKLNKLGPQHTELPRSETGLPKGSIVLTNQIRTLDKTRLIRKVGVVTGELLKQVERALLITLGVA